MTWNRGATLLGVLLVGCVAQALSQLLVPGYFPPDQVQAASLSRAPVAFYSRTGFGNDESAVSLSGAPVGLYSKRNSPAQFVRYPFFYPPSPPFVYPSPFQPPAFGVGDLDQPGRPIRPGRPRPPFFPPLRPTARPRPPPRPPVRPPPRPRPPIRPRPPRG